MRIIRTILEHEPRTVGTDTELAMEHLLKIQKRHSIVFVMSDFQNSLPDRNFKIASKRFDLCAINVFDKRELNLPNVGLVPVLDSETGAYQWVNTGSKALRSTLRERQLRHMANLNQLSKRAGAGYIQLDDAQDYVPALLQFLKSKGK
jgi:uncharacterized protein (DUF58 family)